jgi:hypothetical protein
MAGRPKHSEPTKKVEPRLPLKAYFKLQRLVEIGSYGTTPTDVAKYLILREIDDLIRSGVLKPDAE